MEKLLNDERKKNEVFDAESDKLFETEEALVRVKEQMENVKQEFDSTTKSMTGKEIFYNSSPITILQSLSCLQSN